MCILFFWPILIVIAITDLSEHKIPNKLLMLLFFLQSVALVTNAADGFLNFLLGAVVLFSASLLLYVVGAMSPGDVKLLGTVGFIVGFEALLPVMFWILMSAGLISLLYLAYNLSFLGITNPLVIISELKLYTRTNDASADTNPWRYGTKLTMPFAPAVVIGLAMYSYFH